MDEVLTTGNNSSQSPREARGLQNEIENTLQQIIKLKGKSMAIKNQNQQQRKMEMSVS